MGWKATEGPGSIWMQGGLRLRRQPAGKKWGGMPCLTLRPAESRHVSSKGLLTLRQSLVGVTAEKKQVKILPLISSKHLSKSLMTGLGVIFHSGPHWPLPWPVCPGPCLPVPSRNPSLRCVIWVPVSPPNPRRVYPILELTTLSPSIPHLHS